jgi:hypothetical protein
MKVLKRTIYERQHKNGFFGGIGQRRVYCQTSITDQLATVVKPHPATPTADAACGSCGLAADRTLVIDSL